MKDKKQAVSASECTLRPGDRVRMVNCAEAESHPERIWTVRSNPWEACGSVVVLLDGISGGFNTKYLEHVADE